LNDALRSRAESLEIRCTEDVLSNEESIVGILLSFCVGYPQAHDLLPIVRSSNSLGDRK